MPGRSLRRVASIVGGISLLFAAGAGWAADTAETKPAPQEADTPESLALKIGLYQSMERYYEVVKPKAQLPVLYDKRRFAREAAHLKSVRDQWVRKILGYKQGWLNAREAQHRDQTEMAKIAEQQLAEVRMKLPELKAKQVAPPPRAEPKGLAWRGGVRA